MKASAKCPKCKYNIHAWSDLKGALFGVSHLGVYEGRSHHGYEDLSVLRGRLPARLRPVAAQHADHLPTGRFPVKDEKSASIHENIMWFK